MLSATYAATTIGMFSLIAFAAFEAMAVTTIMPTLARDLDGFGLYALAFAAPFASGVVGMVAAGRWSDSRGPVAPLLTSLGMFAVGMVVCGAAPTMEIFVVGRVLQGLGGGAMIVAMYVLVGQIYPARLQPAVFASFAAAWVLPSLFGPGLAALVSATIGWRWVFLGMVFLVAIAGLLIAPAVRDREVTEPQTPAPLSRLGWAVLTAVAVLALELLGSIEGIVAIGAVVAAVLLFVGLRHLLPTGALVARRGLPSVILTRGLLSAAFFSTEAYIVYVLQERWDLSTGQAGIALTCVGVVWATSSQVQSRLGDRVQHETAIRLGGAVVFVGTFIVAILVVARSGGADITAVAPIAAYVFAGAGMGFAYPRTSVAMLAASSDADRGFNSSALNVSDSLGAALALSVSGVVFALTERAGADPFIAVYALATALGVLAAVVAARTKSPEDVQR